MDITKYIPLFITFIFTLIGSYITIKINIIELKKDISFLRSKIEADDNYQLSNQTQAKIDMKEVKDDLKIICKLINEMQVRWTDSAGWINKHINDGKPEANLLKLSCDRANILLNWYPALDFFETVDFTANWYMNFYRTKNNIFQFTTNQINIYTQKAKDRNILWAMK